MEEGTPTLYFLFVYVSGVGSSEFGEWNRVFRSGLLDRTIVALGEPCRKIKNDGTEREWMHSRGGKNERTYLVRYMIISNGSSMGLALSTLAGSFPNPSFKSSSTYLSMHTTKGGGGGVVGEKERRKRDDSSFFRMLLR